VLTLRAAGELLTAAGSIETLASLAAIAGCTGDVSPLDAATRFTLGLDASVDEAAIAAGPGSIRALLLVAAGNVQSREWLPRLAARLSSRTPHVLWLIVVTKPATSELAIAAWNSDRRPPRVAALIANRTRIVDSDAETLRAIGAAAGDRDLLTHARWVEILGRDALTIRFYRALERALDALAKSSNHGPLEARREIALLESSRLLFLSFLEAKGWLDGDPAFIANQFDACMARGGHFHQRVLRSLFFGTLNTPLRRRAPAASAFGRIPFLNGGLFARTPLERRHRSTVFSDDAYGQLIASVFGQYRFTAREETASWNEAAVDPEMLGRAFESLMASTERRRTGAFYTPLPLVERVADVGLNAALGENLTRESLERLCILDPACGSGAFLVHALERIASMLPQFGDTRDASAIRRDVLARSIYGVDVNPTAVWLCELRLWLSVAIESRETNPAAVTPLPNLDRNVRVGDALSGHAFTSDDLRSGGAPGLYALRQRYVRASGPKKDSLARQLDGAEREHTLAAIDRELAILAERRRDLVVARRGHDLFGERYRPSADERASAGLLRRTAAEYRVLRRRVASGGALPFSFSTHFADVAARGGFDLVVGNPPWVRLHNVALEQRVDFRRRYVTASAAAWEPGASAAGAGRGFAAQVDVAALFIERSVQLLAPGGSLALLVPVKLWHSLAGGGARRLLREDTELLRVEDFSDAPGAFDAAVYPSLIAARRLCTDRPTVHVAVHHRGNATIDWRVAPSRLAFDDSPGAPWLLLPPDARRAFDRMREAGTPLALSVIGRPTLGVKCGCNEAFVVDLLEDDGALARVGTSSGTCATIESSLLRPLLRGEQLRRWRAPSGAERIIWTHDATGAPLAELPAHAERWFARWRRDLVARSDAKHRARWWSLFRIDGARADRTRVVWNDVGREPRACVLDAGDPRVALNSCYVARCCDETDARAFAMLLNGPLARAWLNAIAEPARGNYRRYLGWTLSLLPIPFHWETARHHLAALWSSCESSCPPSERTLLDASLAAYNLKHDDVAPLVAWSSE
jgi:Type I restriction-modification system methyltransferase subunit